MYLDVSAADDGREIGGEHLGVGSGDVHVSAVGADAVHHLLPTLHELDLVDDYVRLLGVHGFRDETMHLAVGCDGEA